MSNQFGSTQTGLFMKDLVNTGIFSALLHFNEGEMLDDLSMEISNLSKLGELFIVSE